MDKTLEFVEIQVAPCLRFSMIVERPGLPRLGANQRTAKMRNLDVYPLFLLIK